MIRKSTLLLVIMISILMSYGGCDDDGDNERISLLNSRACRECPCEFQFVPQSEECWVPLDNAERRENIFSPSLITEFVNDNDCCLYAEPTTEGRCTGRTSLIVREATATTSAQCELRARTNPEICSGFLPFFDDLSEEEFNACVRCLEQYATELDDRGFLVRDDLTFRPTPPYNCNFSGNGTPPGSGTPPGCETPGNCPGCNLSGDFEPNADNCFTLDLSGVNWSGCDLEGAVLLNAKMEGASLCQANLTDADLRDANLMHAKFNQSNLTNTTFGGANLIEADLSDTDLSEAHFVNAQMSEAKFVGSNLAGLDLSSDRRSIRIFDHADFTDANMTEVNFHGSRATLAIFVRTNLTNADFSSARLTGADFTAAKLINTDLGMAILDLARLEDADLSCANLVGADLHSANLSGATWVDGETKCNADSSGCCVVSRECLPIPEQLPNICPLD